MNKAISEPRKTKKSNHPVLKSMEFDATQRGKLLGIGGLNLKQIYSKTGQSKRLFEKKNNIYVLFC